MNSILMTDFYKATHMMQYREGITHFTSYLTPRGSRFNNIDKVVVFGIANFVNKFLKSDFRDNFFLEDFYVIETELHDDLVMGGRTFVEAARALKDMGANSVDLYVTHLMPQSLDFCKNHEQYGIRHIYSENTLRVQFSNE